VSAVVGLGFARKVSSGAGAPTADPLGEAPVNGDADRGRAVSLRPVPQGAAGLDVGLLVAAALTGRQKAAPGAVRGATSPPPLSCSPSECRSAPSDTEAAAKKRKPPKEPELQTTTGSARGETTEAHGNTPRRDVKSEHAGFEE